MAELITDCPRCGSKRISFDVRGVNHVDRAYDWQNKYEVFGVCRGCHRGVMFFITQSVVDHGFDMSGAVMAYKGSLTDVFRVDGPITLKDRDVAPPPEHLPENIDIAFREGATCMGVRCYNAAATMFRLCLDFATKALMPAETPGLNEQGRRSLGLRMNWMFENNVLPAALQDLAQCVKDDGNDGAHDGTLSAVDAEDLQEFTFELLERLYTEPKRLEIAKERRAARHAKPARAGEVG
jgi:hypothetical protein